MSSQPNTITATVRATSESEVLTLADEMKNFLAPNLNMPFTKVTSMNDGVWILSKSENEVECKERHKEAIEEHIKDYEH